MWRTTLKGLLAYKLRLVLTGLAIILGVAFVTGTFVLTDTLSGFFDEVFAEANNGTDWVVAPAAAHDDDNNFATTEHLDATLLEKVKSVPGVGEVAVVVSGPAQMIDKSGKRIGGFGPPTLGFSWAGDSPLNPLHIRAGQPPVGPDQVAIDVVTARKHGFHVGDRIEIIPAGPAHEFTISGLVGFGSRDNLGGATIVTWDLATAQTQLRRVGQYDNIAGTVAEGASVPAVIDRIADVLPRTAQVQTGQQDAASSANEIKRGIGQLKTAILAFAGIALFVGAFIIANTFSIIVAQRARELALLRSLGASRRQVLASVLGEAAVVGLVASTIGIVVGLGVGAGLRALLNAAGGGGALPGQAVELRGRTVVVGLAVGVITTLVSAIAPAVRGARQPPVAALQSAALPQSAELSARRVGAGLATTLIGLLVLSYGLYGDDVRLRFAVLGLGALGLFLGVTLLAPLAARPVARFIGAPIGRVYGVSGRLARENAARNPQRTAATAAALMVGLALVTAVTIMGSSIKASLNALFAQSIKAEVVIQNENRMQASVDPGLEAKTRAIDGVAVAVPLRYNTFRLNGKRRVLTAVPGADLDKVIKLDVRSGSFADLAGGGLALHTSVAEKLGKHVGDTVRLDLPRGPRDLRVDATFKNNQLLANYVVDLSDYAGGYTEQTDAVILVGTSPGVDGKVVAARLRAAYGDDYPQLKFQDQATFRKQQADQANPLLVAVSALLLLSIIIALLGITNTLALSVIERTRELGLLRAVGMGRRQMRRMVRWEAVIISVFGAVLGVAVGIAFGLAIVRALRSSGLTVLRVPVPNLAFLVVLAAVFGMAAAIFPARRAARLNVLDAIAME